MDTSEAILNRWTTSKDEDAFKVLYEKFFHALLAIACKYVEMEVAKDIVQDIFLKLWSSPDKFSEIVDLRFYLYRSVQNLCLNYIRLKKNEDNCYSQINVSSEDFFQSAVLEEEIFIRLREAVEKLPEKYKNVITLTLDGLTDKDIAKHLHISVDLVKQQRKRGKEQLRGKLTDPLLILIVNLL